MTRSFMSAITVDEAVAALGSGARPVAGGTDLVVGARQGKAPLPEAVVAIDRIEALWVSTSAGGGLHMGSLTTHEAIVASPVVRSDFTALADASAIVGFARHARQRHDRRQRHERLAGDGHRRSAAVSGRGRDAALRIG